MPLWLREDARGEYVWDEPVEDACLRTGRPYGPRAVAVPPWTPVQGPRVLCGAGDRAALLPEVARALRELPAREGWTGLHLQFAAEDEVEPFLQAGFLARLTWQVQWAVRPWEEHVAALPRKRRTALRRELRAWQEQGLDLEIQRGDEAGDAVWAAAAGLYVDTAFRHGEVDPPFGAAFFEGLRRGMAGSIRFFLARKAGELVGLSMHVVADGALYGRTWGRTWDLPYLHFNLAYHHPMRWAAEQGLLRFEPGHGGEYKRRRGLEPRVMASLHAFVDPDLHQGVARWAALEARAVQAHLASLSGPRGATT